jgi:hypothetical protein
MEFTKLSPNIFYSDIKVGIKLFVACLGFTITYNELNSEEPFCVIEKDGLGMHLIQSKQFAEKDRPELRLETSNIEEVYDKIKRTFPELLHPNSREISEKPWGVREFALKDESDVCVIVQEWKLK